MNLEKIVNKKTNQNVLNTRDRFMCLYNYMDLNICISIFYLVKYLVGYFNRQESLSKIVVMEISPYLDNNVT